MKIYAFADESSAVFDEQIDAMKRNGLNGLEIRGVDGVNVSEITLEKAQELRQKMDDAGLETWSIGSPIGKIDLVTGDHEEHKRKFCHLLEVAKILGAKNIRLFSYFVPADVDRTQYKEQVIEKLRELVKLAEGSGIDLCHENEKGIYGESADGCLEIHQAIPELKGVFDPANFVQCGQDTLRAWEMLHPYIKYMHIKDALSDGSVVPAGEGEGHVPEILEKYRAQGGNALTMEPHLAVFDGLKDLEQEGNTSHIGKFVYSSNEEAFDAACDALKRFL